MKAVTFEHNAARLSDRAEPVPAPGEALVRPALAALTAADLAVLDGRVRFEGVLGHLAVGAVEQVGDDSDRAWVGSRVLVNPVVPCGVCPACTRGLSAQCPSRAVMGLHRRDGCFAERVTCPVRNLVEVPKAMSDAIALFAAPVAAALHAARVARFEGKPYVTVLGDSAEALVAAQVLVGLNASVRLLGTVPERFNRCEKWGIRHRAMRDVGQRHDQDVVVDCTGDATAFDLATHLIRPRGTIVLAPPTALVPAAALVPRPGPDVAAVASLEAHVIGAGAGNLREGLDLLAKGGLDVSGLLSRRFGLAQAAEACAAASRPDSAWTALTL